MADIFDRYHSDPRPPRSAWDRKDTYELVDEASGRVVLWRVGQHSDTYDDGLIVFPDRQWLRFPVMKGQFRERKAVMTAVDQSGHRLVRYRQRRAKSYFYVNPSRELDNALLATIRLTLGWMARYDSATGG
jgi:hypothetical protein